MNITYWPLSAYLPIAERRPSQIASQKRDLGAAAKSRDPEKRGEERLPSYL